MLDKCPNIQTAGNMLSVTVNWFCEYNQSSMELTRAVNLPVRIVTSSIALYHRDYAKIIFDLAAFVVLFKPYGRVISMIIDFASEMFNYYRHPPIKDSPATAHVLSELKRVDTKNLAGACTVLGITQNDLNDFAKVDEKYTKMLADLTERFGKLSGPLAACMQALIDDVKSSYATILAARNKSN